MEHMRIPFPSTLKVKGQLVPPLKLKLFNLQIYLERTATPGANQWLRLC